MVQSVRVAVPKLSSPPPLPLPAGWPPVTVSPENDAVTFASTWSTRLPQAIGAQQADPGRPVISLSGDGGLSMLLGELLTVAQYELPVKIVVFNNHRLGMVQLEQEAAGLPHFGCDRKNPDFAALA